MAGGLHVGVIGVGRIGAFHAETLQGLDGVSALTLTDADPDRAHRVARELGAGVAETPEVLVELPVNALVIATGTPAHVPLLRLAAAAGLPTFCEKPVALELAGIDDAIAHVERAGILVQVGFQRRFDAGYRAARDAIVTGALGRLLVLRAATHDPAPPSEDYIATSGGIFRDLHIHDFDAIRFVTGEEIDEVYADGAVRETPWFARHGDVDTAVAALRLGDGTLGIISGTRHDPRGYDVRLEVFGTADSVAVGVDEHSALRSVEPGGPPAGAGYANFLDRFEPAYRAELATFVDTVRGGGESACTLGEARAALAVAVAADRSRAERRPVSTDKATGARALKG
ncbi:MAG TPA: Gfo/Idh/MocA family oxidoreductase [Gaiellaceae bacterium]|jgi:myo-inositol 2-dehydrogenase/D-chiro-inositol 1-dehydrogenase